MASASSQHPQRPARCWGSAPVPQCGQRNAARGRRSALMTMTNPPAGPAAATPLPFAAHRAGGCRGESGRGGAGLLDTMAPRDSSELRPAQAAPPTAAHVCAALGGPIADWAPIITPAGEIAFGIVQPGGGVINAQAAWHALWGYYEGGIATKQASPDGALVARMSAAMQRAGYTLEEIIRAVATRRNRATALLPVLER